jgi:hypothetical protein
MELPVPEFASMSEDARTSAGVRDIKEHLGPGLNSEVKAFDLEMGVTAAFVELSNTLSGVAHMCQALTPQPCPQPGVLHFDLVARGYTTGTPVHTQSISTAILECVQATMGFHA